MEVKKLSDRFGLDRFRLAFLGLMAVIFAMVSIGVATIGLIWWQTVIAIAVVWLAYLGVMKIVYISKEK